MGRCRRVLDGIKRRLAALNVHKSRNEDAETEKQRAARTGVFVGRLVDCSVGTLIRIESNREQGWPSEVSGLAWVVDLANRAGI